MYTRAERNSQRRKQVTAAGATCRLSPRRPPPERREATMPLAVRVVPDSVVPVLPRPRPEFASNPIIAFPPADLRCIKSAGRREGCYLDRANRTTRSGRRATHGPLPVPSSTGTQDRCRELSKGTAAPRVSTVSVTATHLFHRFCHEKSAGTGVWCV